MKFKDFVKINDNFKKSTNLQLDKGNAGFLEDFILSQSNQENLEHIINAVQNGQGAFTFTGPYGSGKSSFALYLTELLATTDNNIHQICLDKITNHSLKQEKYLSAKMKRAVISVVGEPISPLILLSKVLQCEATAESILTTLEKNIDKNDGLILIIDEMGKLLENTTLSGQHDIYLLQQIAELANSSKGRFVFIGILHQSFTEYASSLNKNVQDEWYKIHGRFSDLVIDTSNEEKLDLIGRTIIPKQEIKGNTLLIKAIITTISKNRPININSYSELLSKCWPLNPIVALLLGPLSLKNFGQNQRSIFTFLSSKEPGSFANFLDKTDFDKNILYGVNDFWQYIKDNYDFVLSRSSDARRWILAQEVLDKLYAQASITKFNVEVTSTILKLIALLEIFKGNTGLTASQEIIMALFNVSKTTEQKDLFSLSTKEIEHAIQKLKDLSLVREAYDKSGYVLFDGSDFDIDTALEDALQQVVSIDYLRLNKIASFQPIVAKKHYHDTGTIRWMELSLIPFSNWKESKNGINTKLDNTMFGCWLVIIPANQTEYEEANVLLKKRQDFSPGAPILLSVTHHFEVINNYARELLALEWIEKNTASLIGDRVARHEIENRKNHLSFAIREIIALIKREVKWYGESLIGTVNETVMSKIASNLASQAFYKSPNLQTEILNNNKPSGSANGAVNALLRKMVINKGERDLGFEDDKYPAEWGLYIILLHRTGCYRKQENGNSYLFAVPEDPLLLQLWKDTDSFLRERDKCKVKDIYAFWEKAPYGIKKGLHSVLFLTYILSMEGNIATYLQGMYLPEINELFVDYLIKESSEIEIKFIDMSKNRQDYVKQLQLDLGKISKSFKYCQPNTLDISRKMVAFINTLNPWVMRTKKLSRNTMRLRDLLKSASDPNKLIFEDIATLYNLPIDNLREDSLEPIIQSFKELQDLYPKLIQELGQIIYTSLQINPLSADLNLLHQRAENVKHSTGDFRIDALASRLSTFDPTSDTDIAGIASLAANKPIHDWIDLDVDRAIIELGVLFDGFKKAELYTHLKGKPSHRRSFIVMTTLNGEDIQQDIDFSLPIDAEKSIEKIKKEIKDQLSTQYDNDLLRAALLELSLELTNKE